jgi:hypothetical protein
MKILRWSAISFAVIFTGFIGCGGDGEMGCGQGQNINQSTGFTVTNPCKAPYIYLEGTCHLPETVQTRGAAANQSK